MDRSKSILLVLICIFIVVVAVLLWHWGFNDSQTAPPAPPAVAAPTAESPTAPADPNADSAPTDEGSEEDMRKRFHGGWRRNLKKAEQAGPNAPAPEPDPNVLAETADVPEPNEPLAPEDQMEAVNLKDVEMKDLIGQLAEWTDKVIIPHPDVMKEKITIYSPRKLPRPEALRLLYAALRTKGFIAEQTGNIIFLKPIKDARLGSVPTVPAEEPLALIEDKNQIVQKFFKLRNYSPTRLQEIILPLIAEYGYVTADETSGHIVVIETVENLLRIKRIIEQLDVPEVEQTVTRIFVVTHGDPAEIVQVLNKLLAKGGPRAARGKRPSNPSPERSQGPTGGPDKGAPAAATSVVITPTDSPIVLIPEPRRKWIIARASADDMIQIEEWIEKLDKKESTESDTETVPLKYVEAREVADRLNQVLGQAPGSELKASILVQPLSQARQIMIYGSAEKREMVKKLIAEIDIPPGLFDTKQFTLQYGDAEEIKELIDELYDINKGLSRYSYRRRDYTSPDSVRAIAFPSLKQVTVIASAENMEKITEQIAEWDVPLNVEDVKPLIIELRNSDPVKMVNLLSDLFTEQSTEQRPSWYYYYYGQDETKEKIVGALYGKLTFKAVPETKKIIIISQIPEAYKVIKQLVAELDQQEPAELPMIVTLKYADAEDLCDQLNAILNEPGTTATLRRSKRGLSEVVEDKQTGKTTTQTGQEDTAKSDEIKPWWDSARRRADEEMPASNLIGKIRFIPVHRSKAILVLAAEEYLDSIKAMIEELDQPGKQVMIKAVIVEVNHSSMTSLGIKVSSDSAAFGAVGENSLALSLTTAGDLQYQQSFGSGGLYTFTAKPGFNVHTLIDMLIKQAGARVLNQPTLWTKDNEEAEFFKGGQVPFIEGSTISAEAGATRETVQYRAVGLRLRIRPNITPEKAVNMIIDINISQVEPDTINGNIVTSEFKTITHTTVANGQTIMLSGVLFQTDSTIIHKTPLLGDLPLLGPLFRHKEIVKTNNELLTFITPYVIENELASQIEPTDESGSEQLENALQKMEDIRATLDEKLEKIKN